MVDAHSIEVGHAAVPETRLFKLLASGKPAFGAYALNGPRVIVEMLGYAGLDYAVIDKMVTLPTDWETAADLASAAYQFGMTPWIRLQSYPWSGKRPMVDTRLAADVVLALSIGFQVVQVSTDGAEQIEVALEPRLNRHRRVHLESFDRIAQVYGGGEGYTEDLIESRTLIVPSIESERGLAAFDEIVALPAVRLVKFGMGDLLEVLGHPGDVSHPEVKRFVAKSVVDAAKHGVQVVVNMPGVYTPEGVREVSDWLTAAGVAVIEIPYYTHIVNHFYYKTLSLVRGPER
jgi:2-keto-3-deoxy-L-rhamnonate aldolase RhmA